MTPEQHLVADFHHAFDAVRAATPTVVDPDTRALRMQLLQEELDEVADALTLEDLPAIAKELADLLYVVYGTAVSYGIDLGPVVQEVHRSNMTKVGGTRRADGTWIKPATYSPADVAPLLEAQRHDPVPHQTPRSYAAHRTALLQDPSSPSWVHRLILDLDHKDPVDVLGALEALRTLMQRRCHEALHRPMHTHG